MYHDKHFQTDPAFILMMFNHTQIKKATTAGFLLTKKANFKNIVERICHMNRDTLKELSERLKRGDKIIPESEEEKHCYQLIKDLDHVSGHVEGSGTSKKHMNNEVWALLAYLGAPTWYITFAPSDESHPLALYFASHDTNFIKYIPPSNVHHRLIRSNPVAGARFFHYVVQAFLKHVLQVDSKTLPGLWGHTKGYYGTIEQQG